MGKCKQTKCPHNLWQVCAIGRMIFPVSESFILCWKHQKWVNLFSENVSLICPHQKFWENPEHTITLKSLSKMKSFGTAPHTDLLGNKNGWSFVKRAHVHVHQQSHYSTKAQKYECQAQWEKNHEDQRVVHFFGTCKRWSVVVANQHYSFMFALCACYTLLTAWKAEGFWKGLKVSF